MKMDCEVIRDLLPLYAENMVSEKSRALTEEHLAACEPCRQYLSTLTTPEPDVQFRLDSAKQFVAYEKKQKRRVGCKVGIVAGVLGIAATLVIGRILVLTGCVGLVLLDSALAKVKVDTDPANYSQHFGETAGEEYTFKKARIDESIFPAELTDQMTIVNYQHVYYNPWDAQDVCYLTVAYSPEDYAAEAARLETCGITEYEGYYGVTGFPTGEPLAVSADPSYGFVYAFNTPDTENTITYCELFFCNYFFDLKYEDYIPAEYLPLNFEAHQGNPYRQKIMGEN